MCEFKKMEEITAHRNSQITEELSGTSARTQMEHAAGLAQSVERLTAERKVAGSIPEAGPKLRVLK